MEPKKKRKTRSIKSLNYIQAVIKQYPWFKYSAIALLLFLIIKLFILELCVVNNEDMANTYHVKDMVLVNKLYYKIDYNDVVYFEYPAKDSSEKRSLFIQRCIAKPGDTLFIRDKLIFVNGDTIHDPQSIKYNYLIDTDTFRIDSLIKKRFGLIEGGSISKNGKYSYSLTKEQVDSLKTDSRFLKIELRLEKENIYDGRVYPYSRLFAWNSDNFGKLYIPKKGDTLSLDTVNIKLYGQLINRYENNKLRISSDSIFINDQLSSSYAVKQDYYFVMGDNRDNAIDSRRWGLLPNGYIKGKVIGTLYRKHKNEIGFK
ncbi:MAG: signal peptidase I [Sphingobacteriaceae bacterium]